MTPTSPMLDPRAIHRQLVESDPVPLADLPRDHGIYALHDHAGVIRYVGITPGDPKGLRGRIHDRHAAGSEGRSHKFSHAYNTGRMSRDKKDDRPDAKLAKRLRTAFARRHCRATFVIVPPELHAALPGVEIAVQALAPPGLLAWGDDREFRPYPEPVDLVDELIDQLGWSLDQRLALDRQAALHRSASRRTKAVPVLLAGHPRPG